jgi:hypothetical protein
MVVKRELFLRSIGFDEQMDGALWALRDFARKTTANGFKTISVCNRQLRLEKHQLLGSESRREQTVKAAKQLYTERWGEPVTFMVICSEALPCGSVADFRELLLVAARQGNCVTVAAVGKLARLLMQEGFAALHENITIQPLPRFFAERALRRSIERMISEDAGAMIVTDGAATSGQSHSLTFADFTGRISDRTARLYRGGINA